MGMKNKLLSAAVMTTSALVFMLMGCAETFYRPFDGDIGYSDVTIAKDKCEIMFYGPEDQDPLAAKEYAMLRAADIGKQSNFAYFRVTNDKEREQNSTTAVVQQYYPEYYHHRHPWGGGGEVVTEVDEKRPVIRLVVQYQNDDCGDCLSVDGKLKEGVQLGILKAP
jgi:hypothetical protein